MANAVSGFHFTKFDDFQHFLEFARMRNEKTPKKEEMRKRLVGIHQQAFEALDKLYSDSFISKQLNQMTAILKLLFGEKEFAKIPFKEVTDFSAVRPVNIEFCFMRIGDPFLQNRTFFVIKSQGRYMQYFQDAGDEADTATCWAHDNSTSYTAFENFSNYLLGDDPNLENRAPFAKLQRAVLLYKTTKEAISKTIVENSNLILEIGEIITDFAYCPSSLNQLSNPVENKLNYNKLNILPAIKE